MQVLVIDRRGLLIGAGATLVGGSPDAQEPAAGKIVSIRGNAFAEGHSNARRALQPTAEVFVGDLVETETNSNLTMHLGEATLVKLGALAKLLIDKFVVNVGGTLNLEQGPLLIDRNDSAKRESLKVHSPFALIAVRGTLFFAGPSNGVFGVFVGRGTSSRSPAATGLSLSDLGLAATSPTPVTRRVSPEGGHPGGSWRR